MPGDGGRRAGDGATGKTGLPEEKFSEGEGGSLRGEGENPFPKGFPLPPSRVPAFFQSRNGHGDDI